MSSTTSALTFKPWAPENESDKSLGSVLARIQLDRGHFRDITEQSLQEEIATEGALELSGSESGSSESDESEDADDDRAAGADKDDGPSSGVKSLEELLKAKMELLQHIRAAQDDIDYARDFISLLVSKDLPRQAASSMAPSLAKEIPFGTLGFDLWHRMPAETAREAQEEALAVNVRMEGLQRGADGLLAAATRLESNVRRETKYWEQILSISGKGWNVSKIPGGGLHRLGVRFGFNESAPEFARRGLAALNITSGGDIALDAGVGSRLKGVKATMRKAGVIIGSSKLPSLPDDEETTLESRIRFARDSLFDEELYHEMIRESRSLASIGIRVDKTAIMCPIPSTDLEFCFDLVPLDSANRPDRGDSAGIDSVAEAMAAVARLFLIQAHRDRLAQKSEIPPALSENKRSDKKILPILRPIMSFAMHRSSLDRLNTYVATLHEMLTAAKIEVTFRKATLQLAENTNIEDSETLISALMQPWHSTAELEIQRPDQDSLVLSFAIETTLARSFGSSFLLQIPSQNARYLFTDVEELIPAADDILASALAKSLHHALGSGWLCMDREALLVGNGKNGQDDGKLWVRVESQHDRRLSLASAKKEMKWMAGEQSSDAAFWAAWRGLES